MKIYVRYSARAVTESDLRDAFAPFGQISGAGLIRLPPNDEPMGIGYVELADRVALTAAISGIDHVTIGGVPVKLDEPRCGIGRRPGVDRRFGSRPAPSDRRQATRRSLPRFVD